VRPLLIREQTLTLQERLDLLEWADWIGRERDNEDFMTSLF
jgi:hypothetical protein